MYLLEIDRVLNRVHITLAERFDASQAKALQDELQLRLKELDRGFSILCDLTTLEEFDELAEPYYRSIMDLCNQNGVSKVVRIIPNPVQNFGLTVMSHFHYASGVPVIICRNLREALENL